MALEIENCFLSSSDDKTRLAEMLGHVMQELNLHKMCTLTGKNNIYLVSYRISVNKINVLIYIIIIINVLLF